MAANAITTPELQIESQQEDSGVREVTGWKQRIAELLQSIFEGHGENLFDGL